MVRWGVGACVCGSVVRKIVKFFRTFKFKISKQGFQMTRFFEVVFGCLWCRRCFEGRRWVWGMGNGHGDRFSLEFC